MGEVKTYEGSCHCGKVRYEVTTDLASLMQCNCSICSRKAAIMAFVPTSAFTLKSGADAVTDYQFGKKNIHHLFCSSCGIHTHGSGKLGGKEMNMINVRCLAGVDTSGKEIQHFDGKSL